MADNRRQGAPEIPDWTVVGVFADGDGLPEFSYTIGLHERGLPELFCWDQPSTGDDPGEDWGFHGLERGALLNHWARRLINGGLHPGMTWTEEMDLGLTSVTFTAGELVGPLQVGAVMLAPGVQVMPILYALHRDPLRQPVELDEAGRSEVRQWTQEVVAALTTGRGARPSAKWLPSAPYDTALQQRFGPATPLVTSLRAAARAAGPAELEDLVLLSVTLEEGAGHISARRAIAATCACARAVGLHEQRDAAHDVAKRDARRRTQERAVRRDFAESVGENPDSRAGREAVDSITDQLGIALAAAYSAAVLVDVLAPDVRGAALGPALCALTAGSLPRFWFDEQVRVKALALLGDLTATQILGMSRALDDVQDEAWLVHAAALVSGRDSPPADELLAGTPTHRRLAPMLGNDSLPQNALSRSVEDVARAVACPELREAAIVLARFRAACVSC